MNNSYDRLSLSTSNFKEKEYATLREQEHLLWACAVFDRDGWVFQYPDCGATTHLDACHIVSRAIAKTRHNVSNGITLCRRHQHLLPQSAPRVGEIPSRVEPRFPAG